MACGASPRLAWPARLKYVSKHLLNPPTHICLRLFRYELIVAAHNRRLLGGNKAAGSLAFVGSPAAEPPSHVPSQLAASGQVSLIPPVPEVEPLQQVPCTRNSPTRTRQSASTHPGPTTPYRYDAGPLPRSSPPSITKAGAQLQLCFDGTLPWVPRSVSLNANELDHCRIKTCTLYAKNSSSLPWPRTIRLLASTTPFPRPGLKAAGTGLSY